MKKVLGALSITLLLSAGSIYAASNASTNLLNWYNKSFERESGELSITTFNGLKSIAKEMKTVYKESVQTIDSEIKNILSREVTKSKNEIESQTKDLLNSVDKTVTELRDENFEDYADNSNIEEEVEEDIMKVLEEVLGE